MLVRFIVDQQTPYGTYEQGQKIDVPRAVAEKWLARGIVEDPKRSIVYVAPENSAVNVAKATRYKKRIRKRK